MADEFSINIRGIEETQRKLYQFSDKLGDQVTKLGLKSGANLLQKKIRQAAPKKTGTLRRSIFVKVSKLNSRRKNGVVGMYLSIFGGRKESKAGVRVFLNKGRIKTRRRKAKKAKAGAYYAGFIEHGFTRGKTKVAGKYFVRNTFNRKKKTVLKLIVKNIESGGKALLKKL